MNKELEKLKTVKKLASAYAGDKYAESLTEGIEKRTKGFRNIRKQKTLKCSSLIMEKDSIELNLIELKNKKFL